MAANGSWRSDCRSMLRRAHRHRPSTGCVLWSEIAGKKYVVTASVRESESGWTRCYMPGHGSWLDMAESELAVLSSQCLDRWIADKQTLVEEVAAWDEEALPRTMATILYPHRNRWSSDLQPGSKRSRRQFRRLR